MGRKRFKQRNIIAVDEHMTILSALIAAVTLMPPLRSVTI